MQSKRSLWFIAMVLLFGAITGSVLGELIGLLLPDGVVKKFFLSGPTFGFDPATLNLALFTFTLGLTIKFNVVGVIGIFVAVYLLRWVLN